MTSPIFILFFFNFMPVLPHAVIIRVFIQRGFNQLRKITYKFCKSQVLVND